MNDEVLVIGHRNPDADAICSAIAYAEFKRRTGMRNAVAARCGEINERVAFVLNHCQVPPPRFIADVAPRIRDVMEPDPLLLQPDTTLLHALEVMDKRNIRVLPVIKQDGSCLGFVSVFKIGRFLCPTPERLFDSRRVLLSVRHLTATLQAEQLLTHDLDQEEEFILMIGAMNYQTFAKRLPKYPPEKLLVLVGDRENIQELAVRTPVRMLVVTGGCTVSKPVLHLARQNKTTILVSPHDTATTAALCRCAITVQHMIHEHFLAFREDDPLDEAQNLARTSHYQAFPVLDAHQRMIGIISKSDFLKKIRRQLILVDHNELSQAVQGADQVEILEIIDHHRLGSLATHQPIVFRNEPVGSTSTIVADCFFQNQIELSQSTASLLLAGLVSDTLNLTSPTTTEHDRKTLRKLEAISKINATEFLHKLFASVSVLDSTPAAEAILVDSKEFQELGHAFSTAQIEELGFDQFWKRKDELMAALETQRHRKKHLFAALLVTDVVQQCSLLVITGSPLILKRIDYPLLQPGVFELKGVVSRKKQLLPYLAERLQSLDKPTPPPSEPLTMV